MRKLVLGRDKEICAWVGNLVDMPGITGATIGISDGEKLLAGIVYNGFTGRDVQVTMASVSKRWADRGVLAAIFHYPYAQLGCVRITCAVEVANQPVRAFLSHLGFQQEGILREWFPTGDAVVLGLLRSECRFYRGTHDVSKAA